MVHERVNQAKQGLNDIQKDLELHGASEVHLQAQAYAQKTYLGALRDKDSLWCDKARMSWLSNSDRNTALFHKVARERAIQNRTQLPSWAPMPLLITLLFIDPSSLAFRRVLMIV